MITSPYGSWISPITTDVVSGASRELGGPAVDATGRLTWLKSRPSESGKPIYSTLRTQFTWFPYFSRCSLVILMNVLWCILYKIRKYMYFVKFSYSTSFAPNKLLDIGKLITLDTYYM